MDSLGNPFSDTSSDLLLVLNTREVMNAAVINSVRNFKELGERQCNDFFNSRLVQRTTPVTDRIPMNNLPLFRWCPDKAKARKQEQLLAMKRDRQLFSTFILRESSVRC